MPTAASPTHPRIRHPYGVPLLVSCIIHGTLHCMLLHVLACCIAFFLEVTRARRLLFFYRLPESCGRRTSGKQKQRAAAAMEPKAAGERLAGGQRISRRRPPWSRKLRREDQQWAKATGGNGRQPPWSRAPRKKDQREAKGPAEGKQREATAVEPKATEGGPATDKSNGRQREATAVEPRAAEE
jgi:hypothetical protein